MKTSARIMISPLCNKSCSYCCNHHAGVMEKFKEIDNIVELSRYEHWCITGGEPMLFPNTVRWLINRGLVNGSSIFLYTAQYTKHLEEIIPLLDGFTYTLHAAAGLREVNDFIKLQTFLVERKGKASFCKSHKLLIDSEQSSKVHIEPEIWDDVEIAVWREECHIDQNEDFFRLKSTSPS